MEDLTKIFRESTATDAKRINGALQAEPGASIAIAQMQVSTASVIRSFDKKVPQFVLGKSYPNVFSSTGNRPMCLQGWRQGPEV